MHTIKKSGSSTRGVAPIYDTEWESRVEYSIPGYVKDIYLRRGIDAGSILDIGCGTGKLREYLGDRFTYTGIDLSESMVALATKRGYSAISGATEKVLPEPKDKSSRSHNRIKLGLLY
jgi:predicted TPR repeat methyltransferase